MKMNSRGENQLGVDQMNTLERNLYPERSKENTKDYNNSTYFSFGKTQR